MLKELNKTRREYEVNMMARKQRTSEKIKDYKKFHSTIWGIPQYLILSFTKTTWILWNLTGYV